MQLINVIEPELDKIFEARPSLHKLENNSLEQKGKSKTKEKYEVQ